MRRIVEMTDGSFRVQHKFLWFWLFDMMGDGFVELVVSFKSEDEARRYIEAGEPVEIIRIVEEQPK